MNYLSVCSGIEAATVAWHHLGWQPVAFSEIEKFPSSVLAHHYPDVPNLGDMTKYKEWNIDRRIDLVVGGTPCVSFSVAGLRKGLDDPRGNLALVYCGIVDHFRPRWFVWENVPGVLSSNKGRDFGSFLGAMAELGYGFAYRVLDAQFCRTQCFPRAVPQRRRRVFVVGYLGDWRRPAAVLFERESLRRDLTPSRKARQEVAGTVGARTCRSVGAQDADVGHIVARCVTTGEGKRLDGETCNFVPETIAFTAKDYGNDALQNLSPTLRAGGHNTSHANAGVMPAVVLQVVGSLSCNTGPNGHDAGNFACNQAVDAGHILPQGMAVRRLTPEECERLQGFPTGYTRISWRGKPAESCPDGPRYKAIGNSMATNCMEWIGERIQMMEELCPPT